MKSKGRASAQSNRLVERAYQHALRELAQTGVDVNGACLEASVIMHKYLRDHGFCAKLVRREMPEGGGHWTVRVSEAEYDPTIAAWPDAPAGAQGLYVVEPHSPHYAWPETRVNVRGAYACWYGE